MFKACVYFEDYYVIKIQIYVGPYFEFHVYL
jgi:hypothetical protein